MKVPFINHAASSTGVFAALILAIAPTTGQAATATDTMAVSATVQSACIVAASALSFGSYNPTAGTNADATTTLSVTCTSGTSYTVGLSAGNGSGATVTSRKLTNGGNTLNYALYQDSARTTNWGNTPGTDTPASAVAGSSATTLTVYGRIASGQNVPAGSYTDSVTVTVNY
ncbi:Csu type fimbrial protein [Novosphingobium cyanobacteriorum]|uniref:Spore coat U domain-containing protein n=1 Tax=Novosphingobium cyanobacteriorum TaxID=3024215 RepID=A0ABT6CFY3_9SPHN|nr:spore coat U domain-containing protein [Novosphingobium cyanobacteriorum]MDF8332742.1 spore coat U domain-containing protein [Novosphingobium cyanobacteriorum]